jgi:hypothetical protein
MQRREGRRHMTDFQHSTFPPADDPSPDFTLPTARALAEAKILDYVADLLWPAINQLRAAYGIEPAPPPDRPPVTLEEAVAARKEIEALDASRAELWALCNEEPRPKKQRMPTLTSVAKQAREAGIDASRYEVKPDRTIAVVVVGEPELPDENNPWPTADLRKKK